MGEQFEHDECDDYEGEGDHLRPLAGMASSCRT